MSDGATGIRPVGADSGTVMTVTGPVPVEDLGLTLMHEHILLDASKSFIPPAEASRRHRAEQPVCPCLLHELRMDPFSNRDNCGLYDEATAIEELTQFVAWGGRTVVDPTNHGIGRDPPALQRIARRTGLQVVMGGGFYLGHTHPPEVAGWSVAEVAAFILADVGATAPADAPGPFAGIIGEIGVSREFTADEEKVLRGAAHASAESGVVLSIHLPGWERLAHRVLDVIEDEGGRADDTVLCHMNPSLGDPAYQRELADRGAFLEFDMIGLDYYFADQDAQSPSDEENARAIAALVADGWVDRLLLSQDVFLKMMLTRHGGNGYAHIPRHFVPRLKRHGVPAAAIDHMLLTNPQRVFSRRHRDALAAGRTVPGGGE